MTDATTIEPGTALTIAGKPITPVAVVQDAKVFSALLAEMRAEVAAFVPDLTTGKGRAAVASLARKVATTKTMIDAAGKLLNEQRRRELDVVDSVRRTVREECDKLRDEARKPLTDWEVAEDERIRNCNTTIDILRRAAVVRMDETSEQVAERLELTKATHIDPAIFQELEDIADAARSAAILALSSAVTRIGQQEADRAELARLQQQEADRLAKEAEVATAKAAAEAAEAQRIANEQADAQRVADEAARVERAAAEAAAEATRKAGEEAAARQAEIDAAHQAYVAEAIRRAQEAEAALATQAAEQEAARVAQQRQAEEDERRANDIKHKSEILGAAKRSLMNVCGLDEPTAKKIVLAIAANTIPNISCRY
jgi:hypothetical protein